MDIETVLKKHGSNFASLLGEPYCSQKALELDLSPNNPDIASLNFRDPNGFESWTANQLKKYNAQIAIGRYLEERVIYEQGEFAGRCVHMGLDVGLPAGTPIYAPLAGTLETYVDHLGEKDYGPTLLMKHELDGVIFYVLYGHLSRKCRDLYTENQLFKAGELIGWIGDSNENGRWPPHVHVQGMTENKVIPSEERIGSGSNYQGVVSIADMPLEKGNHFDPKLLLVNSLSFL